MSARLGYGCRMDIDKLFNLAAHPLLVHAPIVLIPVLFLVSIAVVARPAWRQHMHWLAVALFIAAFATLLAKGSGEALQHRIGKKIADEAGLRRHADLAEITTILVLLQFLSAAGVAIVSRLISGFRGVVSTESNTSTVSNGPLAIIRNLGLVALIVFGALATIWMVRTGHEGARVTWQGI
jgi:uncharacterized membrane protein